MTCAVQELKNGGTEVQQVVVSAKTPMLQKPKALLGNSAFREKQTAMRVWVEVAGHLHHAHAPHTTHTAHAAHGTHAASGIATTVGRFGFGIFDDKGFGG